MNTGPVARIALERNAGHINMQVLRMQDTRMARYISNLGSGECGDRSSRDVWDTLTPDMETGLYYPSAADTRVMAEVKTAGRPGGLPQLAVPLSDRTSSHTSPNVHDKQAEHFLLPCKHYPQSVTVPRVYL